MSATTYEEETRVDEYNHGSSPETRDADDSNPPSNPAAETLTEAGDEIKGLVSVFKLLSDETRLKILFVLRETDEMNVLELCGILGQRQPSVSHHLALLRVNGLIGMRRDGKHNFYHMRPTRLNEVVETMLKVAPGRTGRNAGMQVSGTYTPDGAKA